MLKKYFLASGTFKYVIVLGKERNKKNKHKRGYNISVGHYERSDGRGAQGNFRCARRETLEEFNIDPIHMDGFINFPYVQIHDMTIYLGMAADDLSRRSFIPNSEISRLEFVPLNEFIRCAEKFVIHNIYEKAKNIDGKDIKVWTEAYKTVFHVLTELNDRKIIDLKSLCN